MAYPITNATGWELLMEGKMISASFLVYNTALGGWTVAILFFVYQIILYAKTRNPMTCLAMGLIFGSLYGVSSIVAKNSIQVIVILLVIETAAILYTLFSD